MLVKEREGGMRHIVILTYACFAVWMFCFFSTFMIYISAGEPHAHRDGLLVLQKEVHLDRRGFFDKLVQPSQVRIF